MCVYYLILLKTNVFQDFLFNNNTFCLKWYSIVCNSWLLITLWYSHFITRWSFTLISSHVGHLKKKIVVFLNNSFQIWLTPWGLSKSIGIICTCITFCWTWKLFYTTLKLYLENKQKKNLVIYWNFFFGYLPINHKISVMLCCYSNF
jgi:hypothetical protein